MLFKVYSKVKIQFCTLTIFSVTFCTKFTMTQLLFHDEKEQKRTDGLRQSDDHILTGSVQRQATHLPDRTVHPHL